MKKLGKCVLFARMDSKRLPGKQLLPLNQEYNALNLLVARLLLYFDHEQILLASTNRPCDEPLRQECQKLHIEFFAGDVHNTTKRMDEAINHYNGDFGVRICCDSPLMDGAMVKKAFAEYENGLEYDIYSNIDFPKHIRPPGQVVEIVSKKAIKRILQECQDETILEHCTYYIHLHKELFNYGVFEQLAPTSHIKQLALDTPDDYQRLQLIIKNLSDPQHADSNEIADAYDRLFSH